MQKSIVYFCMLFLCINSFSQSDFTIIGYNDSQVLPFKLINNLIIIPIKINDEELNFILDTGVSKTILFNVETLDKTKLKKVKKVRVKGLGEVVFYDALESKNNLVRIKNIVSPNLKVYVILDAKFDFSARLGINVHGLIGSDLLKDFVVKVNYTRKKIKFYKPETYTYKKCRKCTDSPLVFRHGKPYLSINYSDNSNSSIPVKLLIDSGSSDNLWFYTNYRKKIKLPNKNIDAYLGKGLSGDIFGKLAKIKKLSIDDYSFKNAIASFPDSTSYIHAKNMGYRDGSIGGGILKRFTIIYDYPNKKITFKKNNNFKSPFYYNLSGIDVVHNGKLLVQGTHSLIEYETSDTAKPIVSFTYDYIFKNSYKIANIKKGSIASKCGLKKEDVILKINGVSTYNFSLGELNEKMSFKPGARVRLVILRNTVEYNFKYTNVDFL